MTRNSFTRFFAPLAFAALTLSACTEQTSGPATAPAAPAKAVHKPLEFEARNATNVALLVPLSGSAASVGKALEDSALMSALDSGDRALKLVVYDTGDSQEQAAAAASQAISDGAGIILGPLFAGQVAAVGNIARGKDVPVLGFSNDVTVAAPGTYVLGFGPAEEVRRVVAYAKTQGFNRVGALYPATRYGERVRDVTGQAAGGLSLSVSYSQPVKATIPAIRSLTAHGLKFNALMIAEGDPYIRSLAPLLPAYDVTPEDVKFLGTGLWDNDSLGNEAVLRGAWYAAPPPDPVRAFFGRFYAAYGHTAPRIASLAYDCVSLARTLIDQNGPHHRITYAELEDARGFKGIDGLFRLDADGRTERALAVLEIQPRQPKVIDPAADHFTNAAPRDLTIKVSAN